MVKKSASIMGKEDSGQRSPKLLPENQLRAELDVAELNRVTLDNFLIEHPDLKEEAVLKALRNLSNIVSKNSKSAEE